jgi:hypothetical protein
MSLQLRQQVLQKLARRDPQLALDLLRASIAARPPIDPSEPTADADSQQPSLNEDLRLEQSLAQQIAAKDPQLALRVATESLTKGVSTSLIATLQQLRRKDAEAASKLAASIVDKLRTTNFTTAPEAVFVAIQLLGASLQPERFSPRFARNQTTQKPAEEASKKTQPLLSDESLRALTDTLAAAVLDNSLMRGGILYQRSLLLSAIEKYAPQRAPAVRKRMAQFDQMIDPREKAFSQVEEQAERGTVDSMLQAAAQVPAEARDMLYAGAAMKALEGNDATRARQIVQDKVRDSRERDQLLTVIDQQTLAHLIASDKLEEARQMIRSTPNRSKKEQAAMLATLAQAVAKKDRKLAAQLLDEARQLVPGEIKNQEQLDAQLAIAAAYAFVEPARSFEIIEPLIDQANELIQAAALLDKFGSTNGAPKLFQSGEIMLQRAGGGSTGAISQRYGRALAQLASTDFDRLKGVADRFQRPEIRLLARLLAAQGVLGKMPSERVGESTPDEMDGVLMLGGGNIIVEP